MSYGLTAFELGQIKAHLHHKLKPAEISRILVKSDGETHWTLHLSKIDLYVYPYSPPIEHTFPETE